MTFFSINFQKPFVDLDLASYFKFSFPMKPFVPIGEMVQTLLNERT